MKIFCCNIKRPDINFRLISLSLIAVLIWCMPIMAEIPSATEVKNQMEPVATGPSPAAPEAIPPVDEEDNEGSPTKTNAPFLTDKEKAEPALPKNEPSSDIDIANRNKPEQVPDVAAEVPEVPPAVETDVQSDGERISMESDRAILYRTDRMIELMGNVRIHQGNTVITADHLKLFLKEGARLETPKKSSENAIKKIIASGNVTFKFDIGTAYADQAEYATDTMLLILTGKAPRFISGENTITGKKITVNRGNGMVEFEGSGSGQVEAIIYSNEKL